MSSKCLRYLITSSLKNRCKSNSNKRRSKQLKGFQIMKTEFIETTSRFIEYCESLPNSIYFKEGDKWNTAQVMDHLERSIRPVNLAMGLPGFAHRILFGKSTRTSRSFEEVVTKYHKALEKGGKASGPYIPKGDLQNRKQNSAKLGKICEQLARRIEKRNPSD